MEFKGTKGKWIQNKHIIESELQCDIAQIWDFNDEENQANALLISKAPEMLDMLINLHEFLENKLENTKALQVEKLIKEATEL